MRILNVSAQKPDSTGSGVYLAETTRCQRSAGHDVGVVCGVDVADVPALAKGVEVFPVRFNTPELPFAVCGMSDEMPYEATRYRDLTPQMTCAFKHAFHERIAQAINEFRPDALVCHHLYLATAIARACAPDLPVFAVCHSTDLRQLASHGLERAFIVEQVRALDGIFALHDEQRSQIVRAFGCDVARVRVLGAGYNARVFSRGHRPDAHDGPVEVMYAGKIWATKGVGCLLEAWDGFDPGPRGARLRLAGGHNDEAEYASFVQRARRCRLPVEFMGRLGAEELAEGYRSSDVFVLPSFYEGLPLVVIEALACGCRVVVSDLPGIRPWLEAFVPGAPVVYVKPPRMRSVDAPVPEDLPAFSERLARALGQALELPPYDGDMSAVAWEGLTARMLDAMRAMA